MAETPVCVAAFTLVAKDRATQKATEVNRLQPQSARETALFEWGKREFSRCTVFVVANPTYRAFAD